MSSRVIQVHWETPTHLCVLYRVDGVLELRLIHGERTTRLSTCRDMDHATALANEWRNTTAP